MTPKQKLQNISVRLVMINRLKRLGSSSQDVANYLTKLGIKGTPKSPCNCPIANLIKTPGLTVVSVSRFRISWLWRGVLHTLVTPDPIRAFILDFDQNNLYPELIQ